MFGKAAVLLLAVGILLPFRQANDVVLQNEFLRFIMSADGKSSSLIDVARAVDFLVKEPAIPPLSVIQGGKSHPCTALFYDRDASTLRADFLDPGVTVILKVQVRPHYMTLEVVSVSNPAIEELTLLDLPLALTDSVGATLDVAQSKEFATCLLALNLKTKSEGQAPAAGSPAARLRASCLTRFGIVGAKVALVACPRPKLLDTLEEVVTGEGLPKATLGGVWKPRSPLLREGYLLADVTEANVQDWIAVAQGAGFGTLSTLLGWAKTYGTYTIDEKSFPHGMDGLKAAADQIHAAGLKAGIHFMSGSISKDDPFVTPVPDPRLAKDGSFALAAAVDAAATVIPTTAPPQGMPTESGYYAAGGTDLRIGSEIVRYTGISLKPPYGFTGCTRGANGTKPAAHAAGEAVDHLAERYGWYLAGGDTDLVDVVAQRIADVVNTCGFDMVYLDGGEAMAAQGPYWYYTAKMWLAIQQRFKREVMVLGSGFTHHSWPFYARGTMDDGCFRGGMRYVDRHRLAGLAPGLQANLIDPELGWNYLHLRGPSFYATEPDEYEYLCAKALGNGLAISAVWDMASLKGNGRSEEIMGLIREYEALKRRPDLPEALRAQLREPGKEFRLVHPTEGGQAFVPVGRSPEHTVLTVDGKANTWPVHNEFAAQPLQVKIRALWSAAPLGDPGNVPLADPGEASAFAPVGAYAGVTQTLDAAPEKTPAGAPALRFTAKAAAAEGWCGFRKVLPKPLDLNGHRTLGLWVQGDGKGEVLNLHLVDAVPNFLDHYVVVDFTGWRYVEIVQPEGDRLYDTWRPDMPYDDKRALWSFDYGRVKALEVYLMHVPSGAEASVSFGRVEGLAEIARPVSDPALEVGGRILRLPLAMQPDDVLELRGETATLYDANGHLLRQDVLKGSVQALPAGDTPVTFSSTAGKEFSQRALVSVITEGPPVAVPALAPPK